MYVPTYVQYIISSPDRRLHDTVPSSVHTSTYTAPLAFAHSRKRSSHRIIPQVACFLALTSLDLSMWSTHVPTHPPHSYNVASTMTSYSPCVPYLPFTREVYR